MNVKTARQIAVTYVAPVAYMIIAFVAVLAYGPALWAFVIDALAGLPSAIAHLFAIGQHARPVSGLACWSEIKANLPIETICGDVAHAPVYAVDFTGYPTR